VLDFGSAPGDREQGSVETALLGAEELLEGSDRTNHKYLGGMWGLSGIPEFFSVCSRPRAHGMVMHGSVGWTTTEREGWE